mmetsp:Transcript_36911/g.115594  ORF Transcript_36911/g.115594 Transcript_36911/m.115594 type:complete len:218 (+) Transcript_36911:3659-4312(+)
MRRARRLIDLRLSLISFFLLARTSLTSELSKMISPGSSSRLRDLSACASRGGESLSSSSLSALLTCNSFLTLLALKQTRSAQSRTSMLLPSQWRFASLLHALWLFQRQRLGAIEGTRREIVRPVPRGLELGDVHELGTEGSNKQVLADGACSQPVILLLHHVHVLHVMQQPFAPSVDLVESRLHSSQQDCRLVLAQIPSPVKSHAYPIRRLDLRYEL